MMNNPLLMAVQMLNAGQNPASFMQQAAARDPRIAQAMQMIRGKNPQQVEQIARNMARERGIDINALAQQLGIALPR